MTNGERRELWAVYIPIAAEAPTCIVGIATAKSDASEWYETWRALLGPDWLLRADYGVKQVSA